MSNQTTIGQLLIIRGRGTIVNFWNLVVCRTWILVWYGTHVHLNASVIMYKSIYVRKSHWVSCGRQIAHARDHNGAMIDEDLASEICPRYQRKAPTLKLFWSQTYRSQHVVVAVLRNVIGPKATLDILISRRFSGIVLEYLRL